MSRSRIQHPAGVRMVAQTLKTTGSHKRGLLWVGGGEERRGEGEGGGTGQCGPRKASGAHWAVVQRTVWWPKV